jgi:hypothetical protein
VPKALGIRSERFLPLKWQARSDRRYAAY